MATRVGPTQRTRAFRHESFFRHRNFLWAKVALAIVIAAIAVYIVDDPRPFPSGGTFYGYTLGTIGALLILWLTMLGIRKRAMTPGRWSLKAWTSAHVYLGLALLVIGTLHTGFDFGWNVHTLAYGLMLFVIASGMLGIALYAALPRALSSNRGELTEHEMVASLGSIDAQLHIAAQPLDSSRAALVERAIEESPLDAGVLARLSGRPKAGRTRAALAAFRDDASDSETGAAVEGLLERRLETAALMARHMRLKAMLEGWLYIHVPVTFALIAALIAHIVSVFFYW